MGDIIEKLSADLKAKEIVILEGLPSNKTSGTMKTYIYTENNKNISSTGIPILEEGILMGVTATIMLRVKDIPTSVILAESPSKYPDSDAAARAIQALDKYWKIDVDFKPLMKAAKNFESMLKGMMSKMKQQQLTSPVTSKNKSDSDDLDYIGWDLRDLILLVK